MPQTTTVKLRGQVILGGLLVGLGCANSDPDEMANATGTTGHSTGAESSESAASTATTDQPQASSSSSGGDSSDSSGTGSMADCDVIPLLTGVSGIDDNFFPEGIASGQSRLFVGSGGTGAIVEIVPCSDTQPAEVSILSTNERRGDTSGVAGLVVDPGDEPGPQDDLLWACTSDFVSGAPSRVVGLALVDGEGRGDVVHTHTFAPPSEAGPLLNCNDLAIDARGNLYATDSFGGVVVRITPSQLAMAQSTVDEQNVWASDPRFAIQAFDGSQFGPNGIELDGQDGLVLAVSFDGDDNTGPSQFFRLDLEDEPSITELTFMENTPPVLRADGLTRLEDGSLLVVGNHSGLGILSAEGLELTQVVIDDSADLTDAFPTTVAHVGDRAWVVAGQLDQVFGQPTLPFDIVARDLP